MSGKPQSNVYFGIEYDCPSDPGQLPILTLITNHTNQQKALAKKVPLNTGLEKSAAIRPFATKKSRLASENILLMDSLVTESCRLADRLATKLFSKRTTLDANRTWSRKVRASFCWSKMQGKAYLGSWPFGPRRPVDRVFASKSTPGVALPELLLSRPSEFSGAEEISYTFWLSNCAATWVFFSLGLSGESAPVHWQRLAFVASVRSKKKKNKNSEKKVRRRAEIRCQWQRLEEESFQGASLMLYTYTRITCRCGLDKPINHTITTSKNTPVVHFSAFVDLATEFQLYCHFGD